MNPVSPPEWRTFTDERTGREVRRYTSAPAHSYPLYYFVPSVTADQRFLVFHSERDGGSVQLHRLDLSDGSIVRLTDGRTKDAGWAVWCRRRLDGVHNHLSALDPVGGQVWFFDREALWAVDVASCERRHVAGLPGRFPIGQSAFSPDGRHFAFIDADREAFLAALDEKEERDAANRSRPGDHARWRRSFRCRLAVVEVATGAVRTVVEVPFHIHHVLFADDGTLLVNHLEDGNGMWTVPLEGGERTDLRPADEHGRVCHQVVTSSGLLYETDGRGPDGGPAVWLGRHDAQAGTWEEHRLPSGIGYVHVGNDPSGEEWFLESTGGGSRGHALYHAVPGEEGTGTAQLRLLKELAPYPGFGQRHHAHPFLSPDRRRLFFTEDVDGFSQVCSVDVSDLTGA